MRAACWILAGTALLVGAVAAWHHWSMSAADPAVAAVSGRATGNALPSRPPTREEAGDPTTPAGRADVAAAEPGVAGAAAKWEAVKRHCTWPPEPSAWSVLDGPCLSAMNALHLDAKWRWVMDDPTGTRRTVVAALDDSQCHVPTGESRPDLYEACAAEAMVRLARLQGLCFERAHTDWGVVIPRARARSLRHAIEIGGGRHEEYLRAVEEINTSDAYVLWAAYTCRTAMDALDWLEALPRPPGNMANAGLEVYDPLFNGREDLVNTDFQGFVDYAAPSLTQYVELIALARRLGAKVPDDWVPNDPASVNF